VLALAALPAAFGLAAGSTRHAPPKDDIDAYAAWRADAARVLAARSEASSLATAAALTFLGPPSRPKAETGKAAAAALELAVKANELAPNSKGISWLRLLLCMNAPGCDIREAATTVRWLAADNGAAWLPTLTMAQKDKDGEEVDRVLVSMAEGKRFDLYVNRTTVMMYDALKRVRKRLPPNYLKTDEARLDEAIGIANAVVLPSFSPLINACRDPARYAQRHDACLSLAKTMQQGDAVMAQLTGFAIEKRLNPNDAGELRAIADRRRMLEWRMAAANGANATARSRLAKMRALPSEDDVSIAILRELRKPLYPPEEHR